MQISHLGISMELLDNVQLIYTQEVPQCGALRCPHGDLSGEHSDGHLGDIGMESYLGDCGAVHVD